MNVGDGKAERGGNATQFKILRLEYAYLVHVLVIV